MKDIQKRHCNTALLEGEKYIQCFGITGSVHVILTRNERSLKSFSGEGKNTYCVTKH